MTVKVARAKPFKATRHQHQHESAEDYTELISDLISEKGEARTCEVAKHLGISHVTAIKTLRRLQRDGYVQTAAHKPISLTAKGRRTAEFSKSRHKLLLEFFEHIGVAKDVAETDVEGIEHHVSKETLLAIELYMQKIIAGLIS